MTRSIPRIIGIPRMLIVLLAAALLAGCATSGMTYAELQPKLTPPAEGQGRIFIYRTAVIGAAVQPAVKLNDTIVGAAVPLRFFYVDRPAGDYTITTQTEVARTLSLTLAPGQVRYVRLGISMGFFIGHVYPELVDDAEGRSGIATCHQL